MNLNTLLPGLTNSRPGDRLAPGIQLSYLADKGCYYGSIHVFDGGKRGIICKHTGATVEEVVSKIVAEYETLP